MKLTEKYRPVKFDDIIGNEVMIEALKAQMERKEGMSSTYLFSGNTGCGKTTFADCFANELGIDPSSYTVINGTSDNGVPTARRVIEDMQYRPLIGGNKMYLFDECHFLSKQAWDALLKVLENPPEYVYIILCTTAPDKLPATVLNRCTKYRVEPLTVKEQRKLVVRVLRGEDKKLSNEVLDKIIEISNGSGREIVTFIDTVMDLREDIQLSGLSVDKELAVKAYDLVCMLLRRSTKWYEIASKLELLKGESEEGIRRLALAVFNTSLLKNGDTVSYVAITAFEEPFFNGGKASLSKACFRVFKEAQK